MKEAYIIFLLLISLIVTAQDKTEYNRKGDDAMQRLDYAAAKIFYEEGVDNCNIYSINQLTAIWFADSSMHPSLRIVMSRCLTCLNDIATQSRDTASIKKLILYYTEGIGTAKNESKAYFWQSQLSDIQAQNNTRNITPTKNSKQKSVTSSQKSQFEFFIGYAGSFYAPVGLTLGGIGKTVGFYLRYRTNLSFQDYTERCLTTTNTVIGMDNNYAYQFNGAKWENILIASGGLIFKASQSFYISAGGGYWSNSVIYEFDKYRLDNAEHNGVFRAKSNDLSDEGLALDLDGTLRLGKHFYGALGCSVLNFKYVSANAGIGLFF